ncbi:MAG: hypothetical protein FWG65_10005 [Turicibacter sp.]|nr:hypothetical protein [Turicibacter sp.]
MSMMKTGDLIGVSGIETDWGKSIMASSKRHINSIYDHMGMIELRNGDVFVWNANPHDGVIDEPLDVFIQREERNVPKRFDIFRVTEAIDFDDVLANMKKLLGLSYNFSFVASDDSYYCSDFIARTFPPNVFPLEPMKFIGDFWQEYYGKQGIEIPNGYPGINPNDMFVQENVEFIATYHDGIS